MLINSLIGIAAVLLGIIGLFVIFRYLQRSLQPREDLAPAGATLEMASLPGGSASLPPGAGGLLSATADELEDRIEQEIQDRLNELLRKRDGGQVDTAYEEVDREREERQRSLREMIATMARERPEAMAEVLQGWMAEERRN